MNQHVAYDIASERRRDFMAEAEQQRLASACEDPKASHRVATFAGRHLVRAGEWLLRHSHDETTLAQVAPTR